MGLQILDRGDGRLITYPSAEPIVCKALHQRLAMLCRNGLQAIPVFQLLWEINGAYLETGYELEANFQSKERPLPKTGAHSNSRGSDHAFSHATSCSSVTRCFVTQIRRLQFVYIH